jgi:CRP/FNR family cyclic AMP-dependent transcriptional regulator
LPPIAHIRKLKNVPLFSSLTNDQLAVIGYHCERKSYQSGTVLFREKQLGDDFFIILAGSVKIFTSNAGGEEKILTVVKAGESFGELSLIDGKPRSASAQTLEDCTMLVLNKSNFLEVLRQHFDISMCIMQELCHRLRDTNAHVHDLTFLDSRTRILKNLIQMANKHGIRRGTTITLKVVLNYQELSRMAGVQQEILMQVLRELQMKSILLISADEFTIDLSKLRN